MRQLAADVAHRARLHPDDVAIVDATGEHSVAEILAAAQALAKKLEDAHRGPLTVLVQADNSWRTLAAAVAIGLSGGFIAVFSRHAAATEFAFAHEDLKPDAVIASPPVLTSWDAMTRGFGMRDDVLEGWALAMSSEPLGDISRWAGGAVVAMTSGSTGRPKCVVQSESALRYAGQCTIDAVGLEPGDPVAALVPMSSVAAFCFGLYLPAMLGSPIICLDGWNPGVALALMRDSEVAWTMLVPTMALQLSSEPGSDGMLRSLRALTVGGGPMDAGALGRAETSLHTTFLRVFGMSECLGHTTPLPSDDAAIRLGRDGRPFPGTTVRAVDETGGILAPGEVGEGQVKGPSLFVGYAQGGAPVRPNLTADGFLPTGDLVEIGLDGTIKVVGRQKQIIIRGGRNIDINEVEAAVARMPNVAQVCVVPVPDEVFGERVAALVVSAEPVTLSDVTAFLAMTGLAKAKWPEFVFKVDGLPQNRVGKLARDDARTLASRLHGDLSSSQLS